MSKDILYENSIPKSWLPLMRIAWVVLGLFLAVTYGLGIMPRYRELIIHCEGKTCPVLTLNGAEAEILQAMGISMGGYALIQIGAEQIILFVFCTLGILIFVRKSDTWVGYIISLAFLFMGLSFFVEEPRALMRAYPAFEAYQEVVNILAFVMFIAIFYLFPDGKFAPAVMQWVFAIIAVILFLDGFIFTNQPQVQSASALVMVTAISGAGIGIVSQVYRYLKVSTPIQRQQTKWGFAGLMSMFMMALVWGVFIELAPLEHGPARLALNLSLVVQTFFISAFPVTVVFSILRYRLWDIDVVIRRTFQYSLITGLLALVYLGGVTVLQGVFTAVSGQQSPAALVLSTLAIAALFNPLRRRVQDFIDRRFYRRKYDAEKALAEFAAAARQETDLAQLTDQLTKTVQETVQPTETSVWVRKST